MNDTDNLKDRTLTIIKTFDAPVKLVWETWTQPEHIVHWWGPGGMEVKVVVHDFQVGGHWKYTMTMPNGNEFITEGEYLVIDEHSKCFTSADFKPMTAGIEIQAIFEAQDDQTKLTFNCVHQTVEYCKQQEQMGFYNGWGSVFNGLAKYLESLQDKGSN